MTTTEENIRAAIALLEATLDDPQVVDSIPAGAIPATWMHTARGELGVREIVGPKHSARVLEYLATCNRDVGGNIGDYGSGRDETAWCSAFVGWCMLRAGFESTRDARARSWLNYGSPCKPRPGCIVILSRDGGGHVGFLDRTVAGGLRLLGGNQRNEVSVQPYAENRLLDCRWPSELERLPHA